MRRHEVGAVFVTIALVALLAGCSGQLPGRPVATPQTLAGDSAGTWNGHFWIVGGFYYPNEGTILLQVKGDGTYTVRMTPRPAANNIAKPSSWSGNVVQNEILAVFRTLHQPWSGAWSSLARSGNTLYGVANDPMTETVIGIKLERNGDGS